MLSFLSVKMIHGQQVQNPYYLDVKNADRDQIFDNCLDMLIGSRYFIQFTDKGAGIIQCKYIIKDNRLFSSKNGDRVNLNLLLRPNSQNGTRIYLQASLQEKDSEHYYRDKGVTDDPKMYAPLLDALENHLTKRSQE